MLKRIFFFFLPSLSLSVFLFETLFSSVIDFSLIDCGLLLLCRSVGRSLLRRLLEQAGAFQEKPPKTNPDAQLTNNPIVVVINLIVPLLDFKTPFAQVLIEIAVDVGEKRQNKKGCLSAPGVFHH